MGIKLTDELRSQYLKEAEKKIRKKISGFSVSEIEIAEATYYTAQSMWILDGYEPDPIVDFAPTNKREKKFTDQIMGPIS